MTTESKEPSGTGAPADAATAVLNAVVDAAKNPPVEPAPDPRVSAAFALGWQMAELYRPDAPTTTPPAAHDDLPSLKRLGDDERAQIAVKQIDAALAKLANSLSAAKLDPPDLAPLRTCLAEPMNRTGLAGAVRALHVELLSTLTAADFRLGKAYGLGRSLADTCRVPVSAETLLAELKPNHVAMLRGGLDDLASAFPAHASRSVGISLDQWAKAIQREGKADTKAAEEARPLLSRQGQLWRALLSGEKSGTDMLVTSNYLDAASRLFARTTAIVGQFVLRFWYLVLIALALAGVGVWLILNEQTSASIVAGTTAILASLGLTWRSVGNALGGLGGKLEGHLWGAELDVAIAIAITLLPEPITVPKKEQAHGQRLEVAKAMSPSSLQPPAVAPAAVKPELLDPVLDPSQLLAKAQAIEQQQADNPQGLDVLPPEQRLPLGHFASLSRDIEAEQDDPRRVIRATNPTGSDGQPAPPPVIYLSRRPTVSQFMSVITHCVEEEITGPALQRVLHLGALDHLWQDIERWTDDLRSRFRQFGPCDIRFIEPKLAQVLAGFTGRHAFSTSPPQVALGENAKIFVFGDWATGLPQARNVAARIREQLASVPPNVDCHVIHLGDTYYSGLEDECRRRFLNLWPVAPQLSAKSWTLAGNHDMYSGGHGYFDVLLADPRFAAQGRCSYFALANDYWQILGLDSAYKNPDSGELTDPQVEWLSTRISDAGPRSTILLTHHQPFSAYETVTTPLEKQVAEAIGKDRTVEAWLWGHEHRGTVYQSRVFADRPDVTYYAAVVGHGGVPNLFSAPGSEGDKDAIKWEFADYYQVAEDRWGLGGFAVLTFTASKLEIQYYDEYGKERRQGGPRGYASEAAGLEQVRSAPDERPVCPADVLPDGA